MLTSLSLVFLVGLSVAAISERIRLPRIIGMLLTGIALGPYALDLFDMLFESPTELHYSQTAGTG